MDARGQANELTRAELNVMDNPFLVQGEEKKSYRPNTFSAQMLVKTDPNVLEQMIDDWKSTKANE